MPSIYGGSATFSEEGMSATLRSDGVGATGQPGHLTSGHDVHESSEIPDEHGEKTPSTPRRPLFGSMREALESEGRLREETGGYVIKRCSGHRQQQPQQKPRNGGAKGKQRRANTHESKEDPRAAIAAAEQQADSAGYTVIRRRPSIDEGKAASPSSSLDPRRKTSPQAQPARRNLRSAGTTLNRSNNKDKKHERSHQQKQPTGWRHASPKPETGSGLGSMLPPASSLPPSHRTPVDLQLPLSTPLLPLAAHDSSGLLAASGWVVGATASADNATKIEEPPVAALWPEHPTPQAGDADRGWASTTATASSAQSTTSWPPADSDQSVGASSSSATATAEQSSGWLGWESPSNKLLQL
ncbi:hypothetical protein BBJ28_00018271 [Nothophytophthora sp. Chile5]|nr:hypothetical protein BBJ28_00018271 [Nothophytophthora sp. Chile5]